MNSRLRQIVIAAALLAVGVALSTSYSEAQETGRQTAVASRSEREMRTALGDVLRSVFDKNYSNLRNSLSKSDRDRLSSKEIRDQFASLDGIVDDINREWKSRYNESFTKGLRGASIPYEIQSSEKNKRAAVLVPAGSSYEPVSVSLVNEGIVGNQWRVSVPEQLSASQFRQTLDSALQQISQQKSLWPQDKQQAYSAVAQKVFAALVGNESAMQQAMSGQTVPQRFRGQLQEQKGTEQQGIMPPSQPTRGQPGSQGKSQDMGQTPFQGEEGGASTR